MKVKTIHMSDLFDQCDDIYVSTMIIAKRAKQIIDDRFVPIDENEDVEDSMDFEKTINDIYVEKPESVALEEFMKGKLEWRSTNNHNEQSK